MGVRVWSGSRSWACASGQVRVWLWLIGTGPCMRGWGHVHMWLGPCAYVVGAMCIHGWSHARTWLGPCAYVVGAMCISGWDHAPSKPSGGLALPPGCMRQAAQTGPLTPVGPHSPFMQTPPLEGVTRCSICPGATQQQLGNPSKSAHTNTHVAKQTPAHSQKPNPACAHTCTCSLLLHTCTCIHTSRHTHTHTNVQPPTAEGVPQGSVALLAACG